MAKSSLSRILSAVTAFVLFCTIAVCPVPAYAEEAYRGSAQKGWHGHQSTYLDRGMFTQPSQYYNPSYEDLVLRIGMRYGEDLVSSVSFENIAGDGFVLGFYDEDGIFHAQRQTKTRYIFLNTVSEEKGYEKENGEWIVETVYSFQIVSGIDSSVLISVDSETEELAIIAANNGEIRYNGNSYRGGFQLTRDGSRFSVIHFTSLEDYVKGLLPVTMDPEWPEEALQAQAVLLRTHAIYELGQKEGFPFDFAPDDSGLHYVGSSAAEPRTDAAVDATAGQVLRYQGNVCQPCYFFADGGGTEDGEHVFSVEQPYLAGKTDPFEAAMQEFIPVWDVQKSGMEIAAALRENGLDTKTVRQLSPQYSKTGNVIAVQTRDTEGKSCELSGWKFCRALGLPGSRFQIKKLGTRFLFSGTGEGHGCGMSQLGAYAMAEQYDYDYTDILRFYFTGAYVQ